MSSVIYFVQRESDDAIKIGTTSDLRTRLSALKATHGRLNLLGIIDGGVAREKILHWCFRSDRIDGEFFNPTAELAELINTYAKVPAVKRRRRKAKINESTVVTVKMTHQERDTLREMAKEYGYVIGRGREAEWGSVRQFVLAIARGELSVVRVTNNNQP